MPRRERADARERGVKRRQPAFRGWHSREAL